MVSDRMLEQLQHLNEVSLELAYAQKIPDIFDLMTRAATKLLEKSYTRVSLIQIKDNKALRLQDNTKIREQYLKGLSDNKNILQIT